ncbi:MAG TPA: heme ABC exporter ATP-binding protein CcmA [Candidatus Binataceae bacterium]|jgi:heme exporter protein A|nr:heme ABC exporter ATP-binding protein CcmA [Candidatus Binataceae bacterium]
MSAALIEARALARSFGPTPVLRGINLAIEAGRGVAITGANGAGKSTLIRLLAGLAAPTSGSALLFGEPACSLAPALRRRIGLLTHQSFLYPNLTARENLDFYATLYGLDDRRGAVDRWLERVGLAGAGDGRVRGFSRGMEQRLALARTMLAAPDVLLLDEPLSALDADGAALALAFMREAMARGAAVLVSAHQSRPLEELGFESLALVRGRLVRPQAPRAPTQAVSRPVAMG